MNWFLKNDSIVGVLQKDGRQIVHISKTDNNPGFSFVHSIHGHDRQIKLKTKQNMQIKKDKNKTVKQKKNLRDKKGEEKEPTKLC